MVDIKCQSYLTDSLNTKSEGSNRRWAVSLAWVAAQFVGWRGRGGGGVAGYCFTNVKFTTFTARHAEDDVGRGACHCEIIPNNEIAFCFQK